MNLEKLRVNLQHFAEEDNSTAGGDENTTDNNDVNTEGQGYVNAGDEPEDKNGDDDESKTVNMTQEEFDKVISDRLARERKKNEDDKQKERDESERKRLEEQEEYKELYEKMKKEKEESEARSIDASKTAALTEAGYSKEQADYLKGTLSGETDEDIKASIEEISKMFPPEKKTYADPSAGNGRKQAAPKKNEEDLGHSAYERLKGKIGRK